MTSLLVRWNSLRKRLHPAQWLLGVVVLGGCAMVASDRLEEYFGPAEPRERMVASTSSEGGNYLHEVQPILEQRCVVCHGCYDSPCQLNLSAPEGIDRGASKLKVYNGARLSEAPLTRLVEDVKTTAEWREMGFYPVLNEHEQTPQANREASVLNRMLQLKRQHPLPEGPLLDETVFDLGLNRKQECPNPSEMDKYVAKRPLWGMPYALPGLSDDESNTLERWLENGAAMAQPAAISVAAQARLDGWEAFLNGDSLKEQLMSRYLYEHWFLAHLYFSDLNDGLFYRVVRSSTPPGQPIGWLPTRRPYDDPGVDRVYYRLWRDHSTILDKTHMPYALDAERKVWLSNLFLDKDYPVTALPSYEPAVAANPFKAYEALPVDSRWEFLIEDAQFTIMNFIKGPVCRGQVALNVIRDHFWVIFINPELDVSGYDESSFLNSQEANLRIPTQAGSNASPFSTWSKYSKAQQAYLKAKSDSLETFFKDGENLDLDAVWDGYGRNQNAALTVFRHFDSASVVKGFVGESPQTAWLIDYPILERIHYLLVAGFDVFGNMGHQLTTRLYMDFLRQEGEFNFLLLLPPETRVKLAREWYAGASKKEQSYLFGSRANFDQPTGITYLTDDPQEELYGMLKKRLGPVLNRSYDLDQPSVPAAHRDALQRLEIAMGGPVVPTPQVAVLNIRSESGADHFYTVLHNDAHSNITSLFSESKNRVPELDTRTVANGFIGSYPSAYWLVDEASLPDFVEQMTGLSDEASYRALMDRYGVRRTAQDFWAYSDRVIAAHLEADPIANGLLDYNRLENR